MLSDRVQRQIDRLLDQIEEAIGQGNWESVRATVRAVLSMDAENRDALAYLAAADAALQDQGGPPPPSVGGAVPGRAAPPPDQPTSFASGRYEVKRFLGEGGKKLVYLAHDRQLDRDVAFALIKTEGLDDAGRQRIQREAQAMGRLGSHPHVVSVFDIGEEAGQPFIITELMGGGDVEGLIEKAADHRLPLERALQIGMETCAGLEFAYEKGIVHRDLKPGNVWLTSDGTAKIGDFGLALAIDKTRLTQAGMMVGTVSYMPPEQATGGEVTARSDLYSLGAMLYEMVTGRPPFVGDEAVAIIGQHLNTPPVSPSWHRPDCPTGLEALILRLLEKDVSKRPTSAAEVQTALAGLIQREVTVTSPASADGSGEGEKAVSPIYRRAFVGREAELKQLHTAFDAAISGQGGLLMVVGEPGIGKTSVCEQLSTYVTLRGGKPLIGHCYEEGSLSLPYLPFVEAMRSYVLARDPEGLKQDLGTGAADVARIISEIRDRVTVELRSPGDPDDDRWRLYQSITGFLRNASLVQPVFILLEDLHDADRGTLDLLVHLSRHLEGARLLIVGTYRDVEVDRAHPLSGALAELRRITAFARIPLRGLTVDEVHRMVTMIRGQETPFSRAEAIHRQTEGNPLFIQEVLRYLVEEGLVVREEGRFVRTDGGDPDAGIPEGLRDVIGKRLSRLSDKTNQVLSMAAVIGRDFRLDVLQRVANPIGGGGTAAATPSGAVLTEDEVEAALEEASERAVIETRPGIGGVASFRFTHAFFRQTLYEEIFAARRIRWHQQAARALEVVHARRLDEHAAELAEHFAHSSNPVDLRKAVEYAELAAHKALGVYAYAEAVRHLEQALNAQEVLDPDDQSKCCDLWLALGEALLPAGEAQPVAQVVAPGALALAEALRDHARAFRACYLAADGLNQYGRATSAGRSSPEYKSWAERADRYAAPGTIERVGADHFLQYVARDEGDERRCQELAIRAFSLARELGDVVGTARGAGPLLTGAFTPPEHHDQRLEVMQQVHTLPVEGVPTSDLWAFLNGLAFVDLTWGDRAAAEATYKRGAELAARTHDPVMQLQSICHDALLLTLDGRLVEAVERGAELVKRGEELESAAGARQLGAACSRRALVYLGRPLEALDKIPASQGLWSTGGVFAGQRAMCLAHAGRTEEAKEILGQFRAARDLASPEDPSPAIFLRYLLDAAVVAQDLDTLTAIYPRMAPLSHLLVTEAFHVYCIGRLCGGAAVLLGYPEKAREHYQQALDVCTKVRFRPEIALTHLEIAELLLDVGGPTASHGEKERSRREALGHLDLAIEEFRAMNMRPYLERALGHKGLLKA